MIINLFESVDFFIFIYEVGYYFFEVMDVFLQDNGVLQVVWDDMVVVWCYLGVEDGQVFIEDQYEIFV